MLGLSLWEGRLPGQKTIENEDKGSHCSYRPESNFGTMDTVPPVRVRVSGQNKKTDLDACLEPYP